MSEQIEAPSPFPEMPPKVDAIVRSYMVKKALENTRRFNIFHPSAWGSCQRRIAYDFYNDRDKFRSKNANSIDPRLERVFDNGHSTHARWQNYLDCAGILRGCWKCINPLCGKVYGEEEPLGIFNPLRQEGSNWACECGNNKKLIYEELSVTSAPEYNFEGHVDAVIDVRGTKFAKGSSCDVFVVDMKTIKDDLYSDLKEAKHEHVVQVHIYMWLLNLSAAVVLYENKDNQQVKEIFVPRDESKIEKIKEESLLMMSLLADNRLPKRSADMTRSRYPCRGCEFSDICFQ